MPTENPKPAPGPEIKLSDLPKGGAVSTPIPSLLDAANAAASQSGVTADKLNDPPSDTPPPQKTPPAQPQRENQPKETPKPPTEPPKEPAKAKKEGIESVREALERAQKKANDLEASFNATAKEKADAFLKVADLEGKLSKYEQDIEKEYKPRLARLEQVEKEAQRHLEILKIKAYQETPEFHNTYVKPLADTHAEVSELLREVLVVDGENRRPATSEDFNEVLAAKSINEAAEIATEKFGPMVSQQIVNYRQKIRSLERSRQEAVKNAALNAEEYEKRTHAQQAEHNRIVRERILAEANRLIEGAIPQDDDELKSAFIEGQKHADTLLNPNVAPEEMISHIGKARAAIIKYPVAEKKIARLESKVAELEEQLKAYQRSEPDLRGRQGGVARPVNSTNEAREKLLEAANAAAVAR